jgi:hypothetical protein
MTEPSTATRNESIPRLSETNLAREKRFDWPLCYEAENFVLAGIDAFLACHRFAQQLSLRMREETGTLLLDWVDHLVLPAQHEAALLRVGYVPDPLAETRADQKPFRHPESVLPPLLLDATLAASEGPGTLAIRVDSVSDFMVIHGLSDQPEGERRGYRGYRPGKPPPGQMEAIVKVTEMWKTRRRDFADDAEGFRHTHALLDRAVALLGPDLACHVVFAEERAYWQRRNRAAQVQKARQEKLGLGWANHDHHTFRSSRRHFVDLMRALEKLGFERRERYYAGQQAGWGAQICEHPVEGIVTFCDVDLESDETEIDFSRQPLAPSRRLGTIGLWVGLHGESFLQAGLHHLECRFDYGLLRDQLAALNVPLMKPFSDFPFLKQAFTEGERWPVKRERAERLLRAGLIDTAQFDQFVTQGALGSHLENLQRKGGFKGFNQKSVSVIIQATDPRKQALPFA